ncbi:MAG: hypothetical protein ACT4PT_06310 [Methanobacteriota archaeon]
MDWSVWRDEFPIVSRKTYLNTCSLGALSRRGRLAITNFLDYWDAQGASAWYFPLLAMVDSVRG